MTRVGFVVPRYGDGVAGGAEVAAKLLAEHLAAVDGIDCEVFTTAALDAATWRNELPAGSTIEHDVTVHRFASVSSRGADFAAWDARMLADPSALTVAESWRWLEQLGPVCPDAVDAAVDSACEVVTLGPYMYHPIVERGARLERPRCCIRPRTTARDPPPDLRAGVHRRGRARMVERTGTARRGPSVPFDGDPPAGRRRYRRRPGAECRSHSGDAARFGATVRAVPRPGAGGEGFIGARRRLRHVQATIPRTARAGVRRRAARPDPVSPGHRRARRGRRGDEHTLLTHATTLVSPSPNESLALVVLEAWSAGTPVMVNGAAPVAPRPLCAQRWRTLVRRLRARSRPRSPHRHRRCARRMPRARRAGLRRGQYSWPVGGRAIPVVPGACVRAAVRR